MNDKKNNVKVIPPTPAPSRKEIYKAQSTPDQGRSLADAPKGPSKPNPTPPPPQRSNTNNSGGSSHKG